MGMLGLQMRKAGDHQGGTGQPPNKGKEASKASKGPWPAMRRPAGLLCHQGASRVPQPRGPRGQAIARPLPSCAFAPGAGEGELGVRGRAGSEAPPPSPGPARMGEDPRLRPRPLPARGRR